MQSRHCGQESQEGVMKYHPSLYNTWVLFLMSMCWIPGVEGWEDATGLGECSNC